jgi:amino acid permease
MFYIVNELKRPTIGRINVVIGFSVATVAAMYVVVIICAYGTYGNKLYSDMLLNYPGLSYVPCLRTHCVNRLYHM